MTTDKIRLKRKNMGVKARRIPLSPSVLTAPALKAARSGGTEAKPMKMPVIDSIRMASNDGIYPELEKIAGTGRDICGEKLESLEKLLDSMPLNERAAIEILDHGADLFAEGAESGFRRGFRVGTHLMMECCLDASTPPLGPLEGGRKT